MEWSPLPETESECQSGIAKAHHPGEGVDLAKNVIQLYGADAMARCTEEAAQAQPSSFVLRQSTTLRDRHGSVCRRPPLGEEASHSGIA